MAKQPVHEKKAKKTASGGLSIHHLSKKVDSGLEILKDISCEVASTKTLVLLGPSGSGKSTLLRCLAEIETYQEGQILWEEHPLDHLAKGEIGLVFQNFQLFPHMTVFQNLTLAPTIQGLGKAATETHAKDLLKHFGLDDKALSYPHQLSGGQKQRIAIARAMMMKPKILLMDEPTSALDPEMVNEVAALLKDIKKACELLVVATHELRLAEKIADYVLFLDGGKVAEFKEASTFFQSPQSDRAKRFIANMH